MGKLEDMSWRRGQPPLDDPEGVLLEISAEPSLTDQEWAEMVRDIAKFCMIISGLLGVLGFALGLTIGTYI